MTFQIFRKGPRRIRVKICHLSELDESHIFRKPAFRRTFSYILFLKKVEQRVDSESSFEQPIMNHNDFRHFLGVTETCIFCLKVLLQSLSKNGAKCALQNGVNI